MKRSLYLSPEASDGSGGVAVAEVPASQTPPTQQINKSEEATPPAKKNSVPVSRQPTKEELAVEFKIDADVPGLDFQVEQLPPQKDKPKEEVKKEVPTAKVEEVKAEVKTAEVPAKAKAVFEEPIDPTKIQNKAKEYDYTGHSDEEVKVLKNMSVQSREVVSKLMKEKKQLEGLKDASYLQHPNAYTLSPEYKKLSEDSYFINNEYQHWEAQLLKIKSGEQWQPLKGFNPKTGEPVLDNPRAIGAMDEENVRLRMQQCVNAYQQNQQQQQQFVGNYNQRLQQDVQGIQAERIKRFTWAQDPKLLEHKIFVNDTLGELPIKKVKEDFKAMFPAYHQSSPLMEICSDMFVSVLIFGQQLREAQAGQEVAEIKKEEILRAEPTSTANKNEGKAVGGVKTFSLEGMP